MKIDAVRFRVAKMSVKVKMSLCLTMIHILKTRPVHN
jgi:hypothetical protein